MTVSSATFQRKAIGNGTTRLFSYFMQTFNPDWIKGYVDGDESPGVVSVNSDNIGGTFTFDTAPPLDSEVLIERQVPIDQETNFPEYGPFPARNNEDALDKITMALAQYIKVEGGVVELPADLIIKYGDSIQFANDNDDAGAGANDSYRIISEDNQQFKLQRSFEGDYVDVLAYNGTKIELPQGAVTPNITISSSSDSVVNKNYSDTQDLILSTAITALDTYVQEQDAAIRQEFAAGDTAVTEAFQAADAVIQGQINDVVEPEFSTQVKLNGVPYPSENLGVISDPVTIIPDNKNIKEAIVLLNNAFDDTVTDEDLETAISGVTTTANDAASDAADAVSTANDASDAASDAADAASDAADAAKDAQDTADANKELIDNLPAPPDISGLANKNGDVAEPFAVLATGIGTDAATNAQVTLSANTGVQSTTSFQADWQGGTVILEFKAEIFRIGPLQVISGFCYFPDGTTRDGYTVQLNWADFDYAGPSSGKVFANDAYSLVATPRSSGDLKTQPVAPMIEDTSRTAASTTLGCADDPSVGNDGFSFTAIGRWA